MRENLKIRIRITPNTDTFYAVKLTHWFYHKIIFYANDKLKRMNVSLQGSMKNIYIKHFC